MFILSEIVFPLPSTRFQTIKNDRSSSRSGARRGASTQHACTCRLRGNPLLRVEKSRRNGPRSAIAAPALLPRGRSPRGYPRSRADRARDRHARSTLLRPVTRAANGAGPDVRAHWNGLIHSALRNISSPWQMVGHEKLLGYGACCSVVRRAGELCFRSARHGDAGFARSINHRHRVTGPDRASATNGA